MFDFWQSTKRKRYEEINLNSFSTANLASLIECIASSFGNEKIEFNPKKFLPIHLEEDNTPSAKLRNQLGAKTIAILQEKIRQKTIPANVCRDLFLIEGMKEILLEGTSNK